ncbi:MAG: YdcF family protein, partial [Oscillospiraceae bacterium]|nr:YdcF family protein [Oscillospiraceae bacterium]
MKKFINYYKTKQETKPQRLATKSSKAFCKILAAVCIFLFLWFAVPLPYDWKNIGKVFGCFMCFGGFCFFAFRLKVQKIKEKLYKNKLAKFAWRALKAMVFAFAAYAIVVSAIILGCAATPAKADANLVVLGAQVQSHGPSAILLRRIEAAADYLNSNPNSICIASGGQGADEPYSEALAIKNTLIELGIAENRIILEDMSTSTQENLEFSLAKIPEEYKEQSLAIATDGFHQA